MGNSRVHNHLTHMVPAAIQNSAAVVAVAVEEAPVEAAAASVAVVAAESEADVVEGPAAAGLVAEGLAVEELGFGCAANLEADPVEDMAGFAKQ